VIRNLVDSVSEYVSGLESNFDIVRRHRALKGDEDRDSDDNSVLKIRVPFSFEEVLQPWDIAELNGSVEAERIRCDKLLKLLTIRTFPEVNTRMRSNTEEASAM